MDKDLKLKVTIETDSEKEQLKIGNFIHDQLVGNKDYIDNKIMLCLETGNVVELLIFKDAENVPETIMI